MGGRNALYAVLEAGLAAYRESMAKEGKDTTMYDDDISYSSTHRGLFPDWRSFGVLHVVPLRKVKRKGSIPAVFYIRERCPHCRGETNVRMGKNYDKNRRAAIRAHLQACPRWLGRVALPRQRSVCKLMERSSSAAQTQMDAWLTCSESSTSGDGGSESSTSGDCSECQSELQLPSAELC